MQALLMPPHEERLKELLLLQLALEVGAAHREHKGRTALPEVAAAVAAALPAPQQQTNSVQQQQRAASQVQPWHEQLLLALGVPLQELHILAAAAAAVQAKQPKSYASSFTPFHALLQSASWASHLAFAAKVAELQAARTAGEAQHNSSSSSSSSSKSPELMHLYCVPEQYLYPATITALEVLLLMCNPKFKHVAVAPASAALVFTENSFSLSVNSSIAESGLEAVLQSAPAVLYLLRKADWPPPAAADITEQEYHDSPMLGTYGNLLAGLSITAASKSGEHIGNVQGLLDQ
jgi:hypothetical protein